MVSYYYITIIILVLFSSDKQAISQVLYLILRVKQLICRISPTTQSTYIYRVPQCMSPRQNWDSPTPLSRQRVCPSPPNQRGWGSPNFDDWRKSLALCLLCEPNTLKQQVA